MFSIKTEVGRGLTKKAAAGGVTIDSVLEGLAAELAGALGVAIRTRVQGRGDVGDQSVPDWDSRYTGYVVSPRYPKHGGGLKLGSSALWYATSLAFHSRVGAKRGHYSVSGGMWAGLSRVINTPTLAYVKFRGRSFGQNAHVKRNKGQKLVSRGIKENNALKAWTVLNKHGVNVLALSEEEFAAIGVGVLESMALGVTGELPVTLDRPLAGSSPAQIIRYHLGVDESLSEGLGDV